MLILILSNYTFDALLYRAKASKVLKLKDYYVLCIQGGYLNLTKKFEHQINILFLLFNGIKRLHFNT